MNKSKLLFVCLKRLPKETVEHFVHTKTCEEILVQKNSNDSVCSKKRPDSGFESGIEALEINISTTLSTLSTLSPSTEERTGTCPPLVELSNRKTEPSEYDTYSNQGNTSSQYGDNEKSTEISVGLTEFSSCKAEGHEYNTCCSKTCEKTDAYQSKLKEIKCVGRKELTNSSELSPICPDKELEVPKSMLNHTEKGQLTGDKLSENDSSSLLPVVLEDCFNSDKNEKSNTDIYGKDQRTSVKKLEHPIYLSTKEINASKTNRAIEIAYIDTDNTLDLALAVNSSTGSATENGDTSCHKALSIDYVDPQLAEEKTNSARSKEGGVRPSVRMFASQTDSSLQEGQGRFGEEGKSISNELVKHDSCLDMSKATAQLYASILRSKSTRSSGFDHGGNGCLLAVPSDDHEKHFTDPSTDLIELQNLCGSVSDQSTVGYARSRSSLSSVSSDSSLPADNCVQSDDVIQTSSLDLSTRTGCNNYCIIDQGTVSTTKMQEAEKIVRDIEWPVNQEAALKKWRKIPKKHTARKSHGGSGRVGTRETLADTNVSAPGGEKRKLDETAQQPGTKMDIIMDADTGIPAKKKKVPTATLR